MRRRTSCGAGSLHLDAGCAAESRCTASGLADKYASLNSTADQAELAKLARQQTMDVVQAAAEPGAPVRPLPVRDATVGCALGLLIGLAVVALRLRSRDRLTTSEDLAAGAPRPSVRDVDTVPSPPVAETKGCVALDIVDGPNEVREAYRALRASLMLGDLDHPIRSLLVTSARDGEGKTTIAANVALSLAQAGERVVVVDCDLRTPALHEQFGIANDVGLSTLLTSPSTQCDASNRCKWTAPRSPCSRPDLRLPIRPTSSSVFTRRRPSVR